MKYIGIFFAGAFVGILGLFMFAPFVGQFFGLDLAFLNPPTSTPTVSVSPTLSPSPSPEVSSWDRIASEESVSTLALQVLQSGKVIKQLSAIVLASDGLILTVADPSFSRASAFQIITEQDAYRATLLVRDTSRHMALFRVDRSDLTVSDLHPSERLVSGKEVVITGKTIQVAQPAVFTRRALISVVSKDGAVLLDAVAGSFIDGGKIVDARGNILGMAYTSGSSIYAVPSLEIQKFLEEYLRKQSR